jgi:hypothetical protein
MSVYDGNYVTVNDIRAEGVTPADASDERIGARIAKWESIVERMTRNIFRVIEPGPLAFDGNNDRLLHFNLAIVEATEVKINSESTALQASEFRAYTGKSLPRDDRWNPKIELLGYRRVQQDVSPIYTSSTHDIFVKGYEQEVTAKWGFVEPDPDNPGGYRTPPPVKCAIISLVIRDLRGYFEQYFQGQANSLNLPKKRERTDDHEIEWSEFKIDSGDFMAAIPPDIQEILAMYRGPWDIAIPEQIIYDSAANPVIASW